MFAGVYIERAGGWYLEKFILFAGGLFVLVAREVIFVAGCYQQRPAVVASNLFVVVVREGRLSVLPVAGALFQRSLVLRAYVVERLSRVPVAGGDDDVVAELDHAVLFHRLLVLQDFVVVGEVTQLQLTEVEDVEVEHRAAVGGGLRRGASLRGPVDKRRVDVQRYVGRLDLGSLCLHAHFEDEVFRQVLGCGGNAEIERGDEFRAGQWFVPVAYPVFHALLRFVEVDIAVLGVADDCIREVGKYLDDRGPAHHRPYLMFEGGGGESSPVRHLAVGLRAPVETQSHTEPGDDAAHDDHHHYHADYQFNQGEGASAFLCSHGFSLCRR